MTSAASYDEALARSATIQKRADKFILIGGGLIGTTVLGLLGLPFFLYGLWLIKQAEDEGLPVRPYLMTFIGALVLVDGFLNTLGTEVRRPRARSPGRSPTYSCSSRYVSRLHGDSFR